MEVPTNMKCYQYGNIRMFNGDCMEFMANVPDKHYELAIVDPPYGIGASLQNLGSSVNKRFDNKYQKKSWDTSPPDGSYFTALFGASQNQIIWGANNFSFNVPPSMGWIFWDKLANGTYSHGELAFTSFDCSLKKFVFAWNVFNKGILGNSVTPVNDKKIHPTQKPVALYRWLLENYAKPGDKILDTHGGSGSIVIACHALGFALDWVELDPDYYEAAVKRFKQHLGKPEEMDGTKFDAPPQLKMFTE